MPRQSVTQPGFVSGELTPRLRGRSDIDQQARSAREITNFIVGVEGSAFRRPGTEFLGETKFRDQSVAFFPFQISPQIGYVIEAGDLYFRFWTLDGLLRDSGGLPVEVVTPYTFAQIEALRFAQDGFAAYIVHPNHAPRKLVRTSPTAFSLNAVAWLDGRAPLGPLNFSATTLTVSYTSWPTTVNVAASANVFTTDDVGRAIFVRDTGNKRAAYLTITAVTDAQNVVCSGGFRITNTAPAVSTEWALGLFSDGFGCNAIAFHEGRLWYGGFRRAPDVVAGSVSGSFENFEAVSPDPTVNDSANADKAITRRTTSGEINEIVWIASTTEVLILGTPGAEFILRPGVTGYLTPLEAVVRQTTRRGSSDVDPVVLDQSLYFVQRRRRNIRRFAYALESDGFQTTEATIFSSHLAQGGIRKMLYQQEPYSVLWAVMDDGALVGWTLEQQQQILGAHRQEVAGRLNDGAARVVAAEMLPGRCGCTDLVEVRGLGGGFDFHAADASWSFENDPISDTWDTTNAAAVVRRPSDLSYPTRGGYCAEFPADPATTFRTLVRTASISTLAGWNPALLGLNRTRARLTVRVARGATSATGEAIARLVSLDGSTPNGLDVAGQAFYAQITAGPEWTTLDTGWVLVPADTTSLRVDLRAATTSGADPLILWDDVRLSVEQIDLVDSQPRGLGEDRLMLAVRREVNGNPVTHVEFVSPPILPPEERTLDEEVYRRVELASYLDSHLLFRDRRALAPSGFVGTQPDIRTAGPHGFQAGNVVSLRGVRWRLPDGEIRAAGTYELLEVDAVTAPDRLTLLTSDGDPFDLAYLGLPPGVELLWRDAYLHRCVDRVSGLDHLEGEQVLLLLDGVEIGPLQVIEGAIDLPRKAAVVQAGLAYTSLLESREVEVQSRAGSTEAAPTRVHRVALRVLAGVGGEVRAGKDGAWQPVLTLDPAEPLTRPPRLLSGDAWVTTDGAWTDDATVTIRSNRAYPFEVLSMTAVAEANPL